jgi:predicted transcriptional regulator of viral defense system
MASRTASTIPLSAYVDRLHASGRYTFTRPQAQRETRSTPLALESALRRSRANRRIATPRRGFHVIVPIEYRDAGAPPPTWFIDDLMSFLGQPYYVGLLTAAALHGASHQQPMVFQVITDRPTRPARVGRARIAFHAARNVERVPTLRKTTDTGTLRVSTAEVTAFDLVRFAGAAGHLDNVATAIGELAEHLSATKLAQIAPLYALSDVQRLGFILELVGADEKAASLEHWLDEQRVRIVPLARGRKAARGRTDPRWRVIRNVDIEVDT